MEHFGHRLHQARLARGYSQQELARLCGISQSAISSYERGERVSSKHIFALAKILDVNLYWLNSGAGEMSVTHHQIRETCNNWPFTSISPDCFWALSMKERAIIERIVKTLIDSLKEK